MGLRLDPRPTPQSRIRSTACDERPTVNYQRARLWLGISGVGTFVLFAIAAILLGWPKDLSNTWVGESSDAAVIVAAMLFYIVLSAPFDWIGGLILPHRFGESYGSVAVFAQRWLRGVLVHASVMALALVAILATGKAGGLIAAAIALLACMVVLVLAQAHLARWVGGLLDTDCDNGSLPTRGGPRVRIYHGVDSGFTGGMVGPPGSETIIIPSCWLTQLKPSVKQTLLLRRRAILQTRSRSSGLVFAMVWNLAGFLLAAFLVPGAGVTSAAGVLTLALGAGLWSFLGLLLLPTPSRFAVLAADRNLLASQVAAGSDATAASLASAMRAIHELQKDEPRRGRWIERVFHPIPALEHRLQRLHGSEHELEGTVVDIPTVPEKCMPWHLARTTLYLSWACFGFLSRAVHCNSGRPELWVLLPCD